MNKCAYNKCDSEVKWRFSPDIDVNGLHVCDDHLEKVRMAYVVLMTAGDNEIFYSFLGMKKPKAKT